MQKTTVIEKFNTEGKLIERQTITEEAEDKQATPYPVPYPIYPKYPDYTPDRPTWEPYVKWDFLPWSVQPTITICDNGETWKNYILSL